jgi:hypothetical protein
MLAVFTARTSSHHSIAILDNLNPTTSTGTVKEFVWVNPHGHLVIDVKERRNGKGRRGEHHTRRDDVFDYRPHQPGGKTN